MQLACFLLVFVCSSALGMNIFGRLLDRSEERKRSYTKHQLTLCKDEQGEVKCEGGKTIRIQKANFGRLDSTTCTGANAERRCYSPDVSYQLTWQCYGKVSCPVESRAEFFHYPPGCDDVDRYLYVEYECETGW